jgi:D-beta-D-heptose 7-phosphate kinase/D-beta-D-heptose 1-phosphate adenosyltransferase
MGLGYVGGMLPQLDTVLKLLEGGFAQIRILVVGDLMLDRFILGEVERISPEAPVPILRVAQRYERPGGAANVAMNLAGLGCETFLCGFWGHDNEGAELGRLLEAARVDTTGVVTGSQPTISKTRFVARTHHLMRLDIEGYELPPAEESARLESQAIELVKKVHGVVLADHAKGALTSDICATIIRAARAASIPVLAEAQTKDLSKYSGATTVCSDMEGLALATGVSVHDVDRLLAAAHVQMQEHDFKFLTIPMREKGIRVLCGEEELIATAGEREFFDVSGADDTVIATLAASLAGRLETETAIELANLAAGVVLGKPGTVPISRGDLLALLETGTAKVETEQLRGTE